MSESEITIFKPGVPKVDKFGRIGVGEHVVLAGSTISVVHLLWGFCNQRPSRMQFGRQNFRALFLSRSASISLVRLSEFSLGYLSCNPSPEIEDILLPHSLVSGVCYIAVG